MLDVFLLGLIVAYFRLHSSLVVSRTGAICFILAGLLSLVARATPIRPGLAFDRSGPQLSSGAEHDVPGLRAGDAASG
jgi:hypothetical protein